MIAVLMASFPAFRPKVGEVEMLNAYHLVLGDLDGDLLQLVAQHLAGEQTFFPSASEIRKAAFHLCEVGTGVPSAQDAWAEVSVMIRKGFHRQMPGGWFQVRAPNADDWSHPLVQKAVDACGGWIALRVSENVVADRARFLQAYDAYLQREREGVRMQPNVQRAVEQLGTGERTPRRGLPDTRKQIADVAEGMRF